jgi:hypothetical protein
MTMPNRQIARGSTRERHRRTRLAQIFELILWNSQLNVYAR